VVALSSNQLGALSTAQFGALSTNAIAAIETADIVGLKTNIIAALKTAQLAPTDQLAPLHRPGGCADHRQSPP
jgi:hypothetical protein